jgi:hypothetical protein
MSKGLATAALLVGAVAVAATGVGLIAGAAGAAKVAAVAGTVSKIATIASVGFNAAAAVSAKHPPPVGGPYASLYPVGASPP